MYVCVYVCSHSPLHNYDKAPSKIKLVKDSVSFTLYFIDNCEIIQNWDPKQEIEEESEVEITEDCCLLEGIFRHAQQMFLYIPVQWHLYGTTLKLDQSCLV